MALKEYFFQEKDRYFLWVPVFYGAGASLYFIAPPSNTIIYLSVCCFVLTFFLSFLKHLVFLPILFLTAGFLVSHGHTRFNGVEMVPSKKIIPSFKGLIEGIDYKEKGRRLILKPLSQPEIRGKVRFTLRGWDEISLLPGDIITGAAYVVPVPRPTTPRGFDFRQKAYFEKISASGFFLEPPHVIKRENANFFEKVRSLITCRLHDSLKGQLGAMASAFITGQTSKISQETRAIFANTGLSHLLAIAGLHFSIMGALIFFTIRLLFSLWPPIFLFWNIKKVSAVLTSCTLFMYLLISGRAIPCQRAFVMTSFITFGIVIDRLSLSMRSLAFAALIMLTVAPYNILTPSFQLSFSAVACLIAFYERPKKFSPRPFSTQRKLLVRKWLKHCAKSLMTTTVVSLAVIPFTIYHFHQLTLQSIIANFLGIPLMAFAIMPFLFLGLIAMPFGLWDFPFKAAHWGLSTLYKMAESISHWPFSCIRLAQPPASSLIVISLSLAWLVLWHARWRLYSLPFLALGLWLLFSGNSPDVFIGHELQKVGFMDKGNLKIVEGKPDSFIAQSWASYAGKDPEHVHKISRGSFHPKGNTIIQTPTFIKIVCKESGQSFFFSKKKLFYEGPIVFFFGKKPYFESYAPKSSSKWPWQKVFPSQKRFI